MCTILFKITNLDVLRVPRVHLAHLSYHNKNWPFVQAVLLRKISWSEKFQIFSDQIIRSSKKVLSDKINCLKNDLRSDQDHQKVDLKDLI